MPADSATHTSDAVRPTNGGLREYWVLVKCTSVEQQQALVADLRAEGREVKIQVSGNP